jgi:uncharacterized protein YwgA
MNAYDFVHLALHALGGGVRGKTKLQKTIYFLGLLTNTVRDLGYRAHFYGPYSADVAGAVDRLRALGFAEQSVSGLGAVDPQGFEVARYDLTLNDAGKRIAEYKAHNNADLWMRLKGAVTVLNRVGDQDYVKLSVAAKIRFMLGEDERPARTGDLTRLAAHFGWAVTPEQVQEAARFLQSIGLIELANTGETSVPA